MKRAEFEIIKTVQSNVFGVEIETLKNNKVVKKTSSIYNLKPFMCDGIIRVDGRLNAAELTFEQKHPILLPNKNHITNLLIRYFHVKVCHMGRTQVLSNLREKFWILKGNSAVRSVLRDCINCRKRQAPVLDQQMANLPEDRVRPNEPPFTYTGLDCFGPFYVKRGRAQVKRYGVIFTCLVVRAIHIEVAEDLSTDAFINALRRFIARRGAVKLIRCDRGTNFTSAEKELKKAMNELKNGKINEILLSKDINWLFNPPRSSHFGAVWERQIRTIRNVFTAIIGTQSLRDDSLHTLMCEVENILNSRPLTVISSDCNDLLPLTPNHLLTLKGEIGLVGSFTSTDLYCRQIWRQVQHLADVFWKRWTKEY